MMECNREEALRAITMAEKMFAAKDIAGAKKFALKAQILYPELDCLPQMIATLDVLYNAEKVVNGERNWYAILQIDSSADEKYVKRQYRKMALLLHPDKNKSVGAENAFKLISEAWSVLSDKSKRTEYDHTINVSVAAQGSSQPGVSSNGFYHFVNNAAPSLRTQKNNSYSCMGASAPPPSHPSNPNTFWTSCVHCRMQYEYLRIYINHNLLCPNCRKPFLAIETGNSINVSHSSAHRQHNLNHAKAFNVPRNSSSLTGSKSTRFQHGTNLDSFYSSNFQWGAFSRTAGAASAAASSTAAAQAANMVHQAYEKVKREREEKQAAARRSEIMRRKINVSKKTYANTGAVDPNVTFSVSTSHRKHSLSSDVDELSKKRRSITEDGVCGYGGVIWDKTGKCNMNTGVSEAEKANVVSGETFKAATKQLWGISKELSNSDIQSMLMQKAKLLVSKKLDAWIADETAKFQAKATQKQKQKQKNNDKRKETDILHGHEPDKIKMGSLDNDNLLEPVDISPNNLSDCAHKDLSEHVSIDVPDPDFYDFDKDRTEQSFEPDQVWATYDSEDGMPRFYVLIQKVISLDPFKVRTRFIRSKNNSELGLLNWVGMGFAKTCGEFKVGGNKISDSINIFSHKVKWERNAAGVIRIFPQKYEVWALYRNWSPDWNEHTPDEVVHRYDMVEVLDEYNEDQGITVAPLLKVSGFKTVFHRNNDLNEVRKISRDEMFRFSHQVPFHLLTGDEAHNSPKGCHELDPAATPLELLQVVKDTSEGGGNT